MSGLLSSLKVLDFTTLLPGPYATMCLADMGADVLRVVSGSRIDIVEFLPPTVLPQHNFSAAAAHLGRNKCVMALNLKDHRAIDIVHRLISSYDIVIEQFRPGVMAKLKLDYANLSGVDPAIIYCSLTGYGQTGHMRDRAGHDINYIARSGVISYSGKKETGPPLLGMQVADVAAGSNNAIIGILAAVIERSTSGKGQFIDVSMTDGMIAFNAMFGAAFLAGGKHISCEDDLLNGGSLYDYYETKDGRYLSVGSLEPQFFSNLCDTLNLPEIKEGSVLPQNLAQAKEKVRVAIKAKTLAEWVELFDRTDACVEPVLSLSEALADKATNEREMLVDVPLPTGGSVKQIANPMKFSRTPPQYKSSGVPITLGHTKDILREMGYGQSEIEEFERTGLFS